MVSIQKYKMEDADNSFLLNTLMQKQSEFVMNEAWDEDADNASVRNVDHQVLLFIVRCAPIASWVTEMKPRQSKNKLKHW